MKISASTFVSIARILATASIFIFHWLSINGYKDCGLDYHAILIFCFLSGYLSLELHIRPYFWLYKRLLSIMIPYWVVIVPCLVANRIFTYKETNWLRDSVSVLGGNLFIDNPVYTIAWYITFVIMLYLFLFIQSLPKDWIKKAVLWCCGGILFGVLLQLTGYFISFSLGYFIARKTMHSKTDVSKLDSANRVLFYIQSRCYAFFLIHGGVFVILFHILNITDIELMIWGVTMSTVGAMILYEVTKPLINKAIQKAPAFIYP